MLNATNGAIGTTRVNGTHEPQSGVVRNTSIMGQGMVRMEDIMALFTDLAKVKFDEMERNSTLARDAQDAASRIGATLAGLADGGKAAVSQQDLKFLRDTNVPILGGNGNATIDEFTYSKTDAGSHLKKLDGKIQEAGPNGMQSESWQDVVSHMDENGIKHNGMRVCDHIWTSPEVGSQRGQKVSTENMKGIRQTLAGSAEYKKEDLEAIKKSLESVSSRASDFVQQNQLKLQQLLQNFNTAVTMANSLQSMNAESTKSIAQAIR